MSITKKIVLFMSLLTASQANAALVERLGGMAYYDTEADLTWLSDANYAATSGYDADGIMTWQEAQDWVSGLTIEGVSGWRLPDTLQPDSSCSWDTGTVTYGYSCSGSEMGNLFHNVLGNNSLYDSDMNLQSNWGLMNDGPFSNIMSRYWSSTEYASYLTNAWGFNFHTGYQVTVNKNNDKYLSAWALQTGDVSAMTVVPLPASIWLFSSGLLVLVSMRRKLGTVNNSV